MLTASTRFILGCALLVSGVTPAHCDSPSSERDRPNVILIITDDQGFGDFHSTGNPVIETPHLDALAGRAASMSTFYVSPVCAPTRASLMTGRYNYRTGVVDTYLGRALMAPEETTLAELLSAAGYNTGIFGKWHLGDNYPMRAMDQGFQESLVHRGGGLAQPSDPIENKNHYTDPILFHNSKQVLSKGYCTDVFFDAALKFIETSHKQNRSFFAYISTNAPHAPLNDVPPELYEKYKHKDLSSILGSHFTGEKLAKETDQLARLAAMITNIDDNVGRLIQTLDDLGIRKNTLLIFMSDNGPSPARFTGAFRGAKGSVYEGGIRSPLWLEWPDRLSPGSTSDELSAHIDLFPTILEACDVEPPADVKLDGRSFLPLLENRAAPQPARNIVIQSHRGDVPIRYHNFMIRGDRWKLLNASGFGKDTLEGPPHFELYDIRHDPGEKNNVAAENPAVVKELVAAYDAWFDDVIGSRATNYEPPRIHIGTTHENPTVLTREDWRGGTWEPDSVGHWDLRAESPGTYKIKLLFDAHDKAETAVLRVGTHDVQMPVEPKAMDCTFDSVSIPAGNTRLEATLESPGHVRGAYQVFVQRN